MKSILFLILLIPMLAFPQTEGAKWDFPVRPGTKEWQNLKSHEERLDAYNIPQVLLQNMNTADLVQTCLNYPEFRLIRTRNGLQQGYSYLKSIFNGFSELERRLDAGRELLTEYKKLNPADIVDYDTPFKRGEFAFGLTHIEILLAQRPILSNLDLSNKYEVIKKSIANYDIIEKMPEDYGTFGLLTPALVLGRLLDVTSQQEFMIKKSENDNLRWFIEKSDLLDVSILTTILTCSKSYLKQLENE